MNQPLTPALPETLNGNPKLLIALKKTPLSQRSLNCLTNVYVDYVGQLVVLNIVDLLRIPNFGKGCLGEVERLLSGLGFKIGEGQALNGDLKTLLTVRYDPDNALQRVREAYNLPEHISAPTVVLTEAHVKRPAKTDPLSNAFIAAVKAEPAFKDRLSDDDVRQLAQIMRHTLKSKRSPRLR